jgi:hypothetical protein
MDLMGIVPSRPWYRRPLVWIGVIVLLAAAVGATLALG